MSGECEKCGKNASECGCKNIYYDTIEGDYAQSAQAWNKHFKEDKNKTNECRMYGCKYLQTTCLTCGRLVCTKTLPTFEWISVQERLPSNGEELLMSYNNLVMGGMFSNGKFYHPSNCAHVKGYCHCIEQEGITHWMPLPSPPEE